MNLVVTLAELEGLVDDYFRHYRRLFSLSRADRLVAQEGDPLGDWLNDLPSWPSPIPEVAWEVVLALLDRAPDGHALAFVIAGPLQDLATYHGEQFADRLVERSRQDAGFRLSMTTIYRRQGVPPELQAKLSAVIESHQRVQGPRPRPA